MIRILAICAALGLALGSTGWIVAQTDGQGVKRPLDLPSGGKGEDEDEEDAPETISFYGGEYEGDGFFWCLDKSCSMGWAGELAQLKSEVVQALTSLSDYSEFSMVAFSTGHIIWSPIPKVANTANRAAATAWVQSLNADGATCLGPAGVETVNISNLCDKPNKQILVLSDGEPTCGGGNPSQDALATITAANWQQTPINTIYIATDSGGILFMQQLAAMNGGTFHQPPG